MLDKALEEAVGRPSDDSGTSLRAPRERDLGWNCTARRGAIVKGRRIRRLGLKHLRVTIFDHKTNRIIRIAAGPPRCGCDSTARF